MSDKIYESYPPDLSPEQEAYLVQYIKDWSIEHGLTVRPSPSFVSEKSNPRRVLATNAPVTLFPSPFPKSCFQHAKGLQQVYNELYATIANDEKWLEDIMNELIVVDEFLSNLWDVHLKVKREGYAQSLSLGMFRSDYMLHVPSESEVPSLKQVEFNTISSSFGGLATRVTQLHTDLASFPTPSQPLAYPPHALFNSSSEQPRSIQTLGIPPPNEAIEVLARGLAASHAAYGSSRSSLSLPLCILFLIQDHERNIFDQLALSTQLNKSANIPTFRLPTSEILTSTSIPSENPARPLIYTPPSNQNARYEVTTVYFRALYAPTEYTSSSWAARLHLERSAAIKCPTVLLHLAGSKKVQQVLTSPDQLKRFLPNLPKSTISSLLSTFAPQYSLDPDSEGLKLATNPETAAGHVLKPQREGGGNNIYRTNIPPFLKSIPEQDYKQYILMELIHPPANARNVVLRSDGEVARGNVISELGIFGTCLWRKSATEVEKKPPATKIEETRQAPVKNETPMKTGIEILVNDEGGYLLRTKGKDSDEGGVAAGFSSLDSVILYEEVQP